jgi:hypothetical protein
LVEVINFAAFFAKVEACTVFILCAVAVCCCAFFGFVFYEKRMREFLVSEVVYHQIGYNTFLRVMVGGDTIGVRKINQ